ncbi:MAG: phage tail protein [Eubacterium sp.]|jgi:hypothetical protein|nr:phage tail protein [Eubacterium sp.]
MIVGKFGKHLTFEVYRKPASEGEDKVKYLTFQNLQRNVSSRVTEHARILKKHKTQFGGPNLSEMTFTMTFSASLGINPRKMLSSLESCVRLGKIGYFIIGSKKIGKHKYIITNISESWGHIIKNGKLVSASVDVTMKEYL